MSTPASPAPNPTHPAGRASHLEFQNHCSLAHDTTEDHAKPHRVSSVHTGQLLRVCPGGRWSTRQSASAPHRNTHRSRVSHRTGAAAAPLYGTRQRRGGSETEGQLPRRRRATQVPLTFAWRTGVGGGRWRFAERLQSSGREGAAPAETNSPLYQLQNPYVMYVIGKPKAAGP